MTSPPEKPARSGYVDVLDLATASTIVLGTTAFFAFVYFLPESKPQVPGQKEEQAEAPAPRTRPVLQAPAREPLNIAKVDPPGTGSPAPVPMRAVSAKKVPPEMRLLVVFFDKEKAEVDARSASVLDATARLLEFYPLARLRVVAFADRGESDPLSLARKRAEEVRGALLSRKLGPERVECQVQVDERAAFRAELHIER